MSLPWFKLAGWLALFLAGVFFRGVVADRDMLEYKAAQQQVKDDQFALKAKVEAAGVQNKQESSARVDDDQQKREVDIQFVDREIIKYVTKYRDVTCPSSDPGAVADWVCIYNTSLGLPCSVPPT